MTVIAKGMLIHQSNYAKELRPLLPPEAFLPDSSKAVDLIINLAILVSGWAIADKLDQWDSRLV